MPAYSWLSKNVLDGTDVPAKMRALRIVGVPYTDSDIDGATAAVAGKTEQDALIAYLQNLGLLLKNTD
jgi:cytochrome c oxidase cbb3-type subunit 2